MRTSFRFWFATVAAIVFLPLVSVFAEDYTSTSFIVRDPAFSIVGGRSTSSSFEYFSAGEVSQVSGSDAASSSFINRNDFLTFTSATTPIISATAGNTVVDLSWSASVGTDGAITTYQLGTAASSGGSYTFESVGSSVSTTKSGLTNGTTYFFVVRAYAGTLLVTTSAEVSSTPTAPATPSPSGGGGGGGGGGGEVAAPTTAVNFRGRAYPQSSVTLLKDAQIVAATVAGADANFTISLTGLSGGNYIFSLYSEDSKGLRSSLLSFPVSVTSGATTNVGGIFIAPTIDVDKAEVKRGENIAIFGQSVPSSQITIQVNSETELFLKTNSSADGAYLYNLDTAVLEIGQHYTKSKAALLTEISSFGQAIGFKVGTKTVEKTVKPLCGKADVNCDGKVNLLDFSVTAYWFKRALSNPFKVLELDRLSGDNKVTLKDFSILAFYWTG